MMQLFTSLLGIQRFVVHILIDETCVLCFPQNKESGQKRIWSEMRQNSLSIEIYDGNHLSNDLFDFLYHTSYSCDTNIQGFSWHSACGSSCAIVTIVTTLCKERSFSFSIYIFFIRKFYPITLALSKSKTFGELTLEHGKSRLMGIFMTNLI